MANKQMLIDRELKKEAVDILKARKFESGGKSGLVPGCASEK